MAETPSANYTHLADGPLSPVAHHRRVVSVDRRPPAVSTFVSRSVPPQSPVPGRGRPDRFRPASFVRDQHLPDGRKLEVQEHKSP